MNKPGNYFSGRPLENGLFNDNTNYSNLSIIGYSSKVYKDDEKAIEMDTEKHLIPWIGNEDVKIDRYDVRSYINGLSQCEQEDYILSAEDKEIEEMCNQERYRALLHNEQERELYEEEEQKRMKQHSNRAREYSQVSYQYDISSSIQEESVQKSLQSKKGESESFKSNLLLCIPPEITVPNSSTENKIIEKTAECVAKHGRQMEVLIKARQAQNTAFNFLTVGNKLYPYYEHVLKAITCGNHNTGTKEPSDDSYDHITNLSINVQPAPNVIDDYFKLTESCPYNILVNNIHHLKKNGLG